MYKKVLAAIDLVIAPAELVLEHARRATDEGGTLLVTHIVEPQYVQYSFDPTFTGSLTRSLEQEAIETARKRVAEICAPHGISIDQQLIVLGRAADMIQKLATENSVDAIVIGSHSQHGWRRLLGSTANAVLHGSPVDVVVARLPGKQEG